ncbi:hypothetical protein ACHAXT_000459 [Thalassiosira profunda]
MSSRKVFVNNEQLAALAAMLGVTTSEVEIASQTENGFEDLLGKVEIRVDDQVVASSKLRDGVVSPDKMYISLEFPEGSIAGDDFRTSHPLSKYAPANGTELVAGRYTVGTFPGQTEVTFADDGQAVLMMDTSTWEVTDAWERMSHAHVQGDLLNLTDEDIANLRKDATLIDRYLATGEGLESPDVLFCPYVVNMKMTPTMYSLCEAAGPLRKGADGKLLHDPEGKKVKQKIYLVHRELGINQMYTCKDGFKGTPMKKLFADFLRQIVSPRDKNATLKSLRFTLNDKILFPSSVGKQTPHTLGMKDGDEIIVSTIAQSSRDAPPVERRTTKTPKRKGSKKGKSKSRKRATTTAYGGAEEQEKVQLQRLYSDVMAEAETKRFKDIRQRLNAMNLERTEPKVKTARQKQAPAVVTPPSPPLDGHGDKAMKSRFVIHVGEVQNLYKSTKPSKRLKSRLAREKAITVDLHGMSKEEALGKLDRDLPQWVDVAMRGDHPFVIPVVIVCGKGSQVLSEAVEQWIGQNEKVANAPKNLQL